MTILSSVAMVLSVFGVLFFAQADRRAVEYVRQNQKARRSNARHITK